MNNIFRVRTRNGLLRISAPIYVDIFLDETDIDGDIYNKILEIKKKNISDEEKEKELQTYILDYIYDYVRYGRLSIEHKDQIDSGVHVQTVNVPDFTWKEKYGDMVGDGLNYTKLLGLGAWKDDDDDDDDDEDYIDEKTTTNMKEEKKENKKTKNQKTHKQPIPVLETIAQAIQSEYDWARTGKAETIKEKEQVKDNQKTIIKENTEENA